jgi:hypothetical protein
LFPIDIDRKLDLTLPAKAPASQVFQALRDSIPYTFRAQNNGGKSRQPHRELATVVNINPAKLTTTRQVIAAVVLQLPPGCRPSCCRAI